jgi:SNF2 family DNA or RNA helicase
LIRPEKKVTDGDEEEGTEEKVEKTRIALLIKGNLDELDYRAEKRPIGGEIGSWPGCVNAKPLPHQQKGVLWLQEHWVSGSTGSLLADDMGLGKTLQALAFMAWLQDQMRNGRHPKSPMLVVAPTGLLKNWIDEHDMHMQSPGLGEAVRAFASHLKALRHRRSGVFKELDVGLPVLDIEPIKKADWVLTTYETLRDYQHSFGKIHWGVVVYDEAQKIKNPSALMTDAAKAMHTDFALTLTGTPVENRLSDLWCIVDTSQPGRLGSLKEFSSLYEKNIDEGPDLLRELKSRLTEDSVPSIMLRRMKEDHLSGLPPKREHPIKRSMPEPQAKEYEEAVLRARSGERKRGEILKALHALRSISLHPFHRGEESDAAYIHNSARLAITFELMDHIAEKKDKVLLFIESRQMQGVLSEIIQRRYRMSTPPLIINGTVSGVRRKERVDIFQKRSGFDVMLLSPKAGGVGLTLTAANNVIHLSRWWNPAVEDQCTDRAFRIGQNRTVNIYYPMAIHPNYKKGVSISLALFSRTRSLLFPPDYFSITYWCNHYSLL